MPTQPVIEKLEILQKELDEVDVAIKHIAAAEKVAEKAADILKNFNELLVELKLLEEKNREALLKDFKEKVNTIEKQLQETLNELKTNSKELTQLIVETKNLEKSIMDYFEEIKKIDFPNRLDKIDNQISSINIAIGNLQTSIIRLQEEFKERLRIIEDQLYSINIQIENLKTNMIHLQEIIENKFNEQKKQFNKQNILIIVLIILGFVSIGLHFIFK